MLSTALLRGGAMACAAALAAASPSPRAPKAEAPKPNVVLVTLDTTRADRLGAYGRADAGTPNLDRLAARGVRFADAWSVTPITLPSHLSVLTGCTPVTHGVRDNGGARYDGRIPTLADRFAAQGYRTVAVVSSTVLDAQWGANAGFAVYDDRFGGNKERLAAATTTRALELLSSSAEPFFLWVHYFDPHVRYDPPAPFAARFANDPYQGEIASVDFELGRLFSALDKAARKSIVVVVADHGESLGEHGERTHGIFTYRSTLSVPLLIAGPGIAAGRVVPDAVSIVDVAPTLAELTGLPKAKLQDGVSLARVVLKDEAAPRSRSLYYESMLPLYSYGWVPPRGFTDGRHAFIDLPTREVYDLKSDPHETRNLYAATDALSTGLAGRFDRLADALGEHSGHGAPALLTDEQRANLSSLGYVPGVPPEAAPTLDPKDVVALADRIEEALRLHRSGRFDEAIAIADAVLVRSPNNMRALSIRGQALLSQKRYREAAVTFGEVVRLSPTIAVNRWDLGLSLAGAGETAKAEAEWRKAIELEPRLDEPYTSLLASYRARGERTLALSLAKDAASSGAEGAELDFEIGLAYLASGDPATAKRWLESAIRRRPAYAQALAQLGRIAKDQGRNDEALSRYRAALAAERDPAERARLTAIVAELSGNPKGGS